MLDSIIRRGTRRIPKGERKALLRAPQARTPAEGKKKASPLPTPAHAAIMVMPRNRDGKEDTPWNAFR